MLRVVSVTSRPDGGGRSALTGPLGGPVKRSLAAAVESDEEELAVMSPPRRDHDTVPITVK